MRRPARWLVTEENLSVCEELAKGLGIRMPAARVLASRGYTDIAAARRFLSPELEDLLDPLALKDMDCAVERLHSAIELREKILLYGDYDVDGTCSVVILKKAIELAGGVCEFHIPHRLRDGYGMRTEVIDQAAQTGVRLVISVDTGIRAAAVVAHARTLGIDVIVTDHHLPEAELPPAVAVINPNRHDCTYPEKNLCGAGVTFKLVQALLQRLDWPGDRVRRMVESFLKLVALATVADVVPLCGENRVIVKRGLEGFHKVRNPGLRALMRVAGFQDGYSPTSTEVAFRIAPRINAAGRMASADDVIELFLTGEQDRASALASQLHDLNKERQETERDIVKTILEECSRIPVADHQAGLVFSGDAWHRGVVGIVASRIVERYHRPSFVLCEDTESGTAVGSGRSVAAFHLLEALETMPELFVKFGGHRQAAGVTMAIENVAEFRERFNRFAASRLAPEDFRATREVDALLPLHELSDEAVEQVLALAPFGCGNAAPLFLVNDAEVLGEPVLWKDKHVKLRIRQNGRTLSLKAWNFAERIDEIAPGSRVDAAICLEEDTYSRDRGYQPWCATLKDVRAATSRTAAAGSTPA
ncbi:MAG TPA: single-stranded-DNA-specific exonuclease RecJ [Bryobacteraceae bacterium]|nr:single-stranded-DNA-specific exonuclease RecJ [Bryobacteraceae bacterium]